MKKRVVIILSVVGVLLVAAVALRWPRISSEYIYVTCTKAGMGGTKLQYRARSPFEIIIDHGMRRPVVFDIPAGGGVAVGNTEALRPSEQVARFSSRYDVLRGVHRVDLQLTCGKSLAITGNGKTVYCAYFSPHHPSAWTPHRSYQRPMNMVRAYWVYDTVDEVAV